MICSTKEKDKKFFDLYFDGYNQRDEEKLQKCSVALQAFLNKPRILLKKRIEGTHTIQAQHTGISVSSDFPIVTKDSFNVTIESQNFDMGYEKVFREVPLGENQDAWEIYNAANSLTFIKVEEGQRIDVAGYTGSKVTAYVDYYGGAIGWTDKMIRYRKVAAMLDLAETFRNKFWINKANNFYALIAAAAALNVTVRQGVAGDGQLQQDIQTINRACYNVTNRCKNKGYGDTANATLVMYYNPLDKDRIMAAFAVTTAALAAAGRTGQTINYNIIPVPTYNQFITARYPVICLPGNKTQKAEGMAPTTYGPELDILSLNRVQSVWAIYGAIVGDTDQFETASFV
jgi:hypothetical protein